MEKSLLLCISHAPPSSSSSSLSYSWNDNIYAYLLLHPPSLFCLMMAGGESEYVFEKWCRLGSFIIKSTLNTFHDDKIFAKIFMKWERAAKILCSLKFYKNLIAREFLITNNLIDDGRRGKKFIAMSSENFNLHYKAKIECWIFVGKYYFFLWKETKISRRERQLGYVISKYPVYFFFLSTLLSHALNIKSTRRNE